MNTKLVRKPVTMLYCGKLKWYQKILQKLHIKNYYKQITTLGVVEINEEQLY